MCLPQERASLSPMSATLLNLDDYGLGVARSGDKCSLPARAVAEIRVGAAAAAAALMSGRGPPLARS